MVQLLLDHKSEVNAGDGNGLTPLNAAEEGGYDDVVKLLLANGANVDARTTNGMTPLHRMSLGELLDRRVELQQPGLRAIHIAAYPEVAELLLANKAEVNAKDNNGDTPLDWAQLRPGARNSGTDAEGVAEVLRQHGGVRSHSQQSALAEAIIKDSNQSRAMAATEKLTDQAALVKVAARASDLNVRCAAAGSVNDWSLFPGLAAFITNDDGGKEMKAIGELRRLLGRVQPPVRILLSVNTDSPAAYRPVSGKGPEKLIPLEKISISIVTASGTVLTQKSWSMTGVPGYLSERVDVLRTDITVGDILSSLWGSKDSASWLLVNGVDVNSKGEDGRTPLHWAGVNAAVTQMLLENKVDVNAKDNRGWTPLHLAVTTRHKDVAELLRQHGGRE
jgi:hypothetical protein